MKSSWCITWPSSTRSTSIECERTVVLVERNLDDHGQSQVVAAGKARDLDVVLITGPHVECFCNRIHFDVPCDECTLDPHESRLDTRPIRSTGLVERFWRTAVPNVLGSMIGIEALGKTSHPLATVLP